MMRPVTSFLLFALFAGLVPVAAQTPTAAPQGQRPTIVKPATPAPTPAPGQPATAIVEVPRARRGRDVNLQIELTITDQAGSAAPDKKTISMMMADGTSGRIRSAATNVLALINVDARPQILASDGILLELTIEYGPPTREGASQRERPSVLNQSLSVILQNGKPQTISQASDPAIDRKMSVEVRAAILK
jgi:hypothetical protein